VIRCLGRYPITSAVKVMISSVRRGLEVERDALPGLILALGHVQRHDTFRMPEQADVIGQPLQVRTHHMPSPAGS
jgi:hypothetical protein